ncbi:hypothetical protein [Nocardiopsis sp. MG754419]|uniref:hypothetical protein n=1 Tax=Nocardiopsis sp. MG754419 TaxID=2259865 RepID=UPI001BA96A52|nr:hypothetical protein [Nocardiopsis sp. MG754419]MBR8745159.1 hypothetical protein [Nocardiopsis sp. MG754419]
MTPGNGATTITIPAAFNGPDGSGNGGYSAGLLAEHLTRVGGTAVQVTLRVPPPLDHPLTVEPEGEDILRLVDPSAQEGTGPVAEAVRVAPFDRGVIPGGAVSVAEAENASELYPGFVDHPFPRCYSCGPERAEGEGLRLFAGSVLPGDGPDNVGNTVACTWQVHPAVDDGSGSAAFAQVWAALDCPGGWSHDIIGRPIVLGRFTAQVLSPPKIGDTTVVMGRLTGVDGRKIHTGSALYDADGGLLAQARATWIALRT